MTPARLVVDTDIVINQLKKQASAVRRFLCPIEQRTVTLVSPVVVAEVYAGAFPREHADIEASSFRASVLISTTPPRVRPARMPMPLASHTMASRWKTSSGRRPPS